MTDRNRQPNALANSTSPYLLQHAYNPVAWQPWSREIWQQAISADKLVIVSIGYSACHWCHVMERETFEDDAAAALMNAHFISIKVDREERPDVDSVYMDAATMMHGHGGWPLNVVCLPDGRPVYAGTYFPKARWMGLLKELALGYKTGPQKYIEYAEKLTSGLGALSSPITDGWDNPDLAKVAIQAYASQAAMFDPEWGGYGRAPKFPMPSLYQFLMTLGTEESLAHVELTLDRMAEGGIYDQIGGGFARYSVDGEWRVPHFEKMLYDNAQLISLYSRAWARWKKPRYRQVAEESIAFCKRELGNSLGGYFAALDADSEGVEGKFYVWTLAELKGLLTKSEFEEAQRVFGLGKEADWEHGNQVLQRVAEPRDPAEFGRICQRLLEMRNDRKVRPALDNKLLLNWNALMLTALADAGRTLGNAEYIREAERLCGYMSATFVKEGKAYHTPAESPSPIAGFAEDVLAFAAGLLSLYQATGAEEHALAAKKWLTQALDNFSDENGEFVYSTGPDTELILRKRELQDNVIPCANSVLANVLVGLGTLFGDEEWLNRARKIIQTQAPIIAEHGLYHAHWASAALSLGMGGPWEIAVAGQLAEEWAEELRASPAGNRLVMTAGDASTLPLLSGKSAPEGETVIYVCRNRTCSLPQSSVAQAEALMAKG